MARRFLSALAVAALALGVAACGDGGDGPVATPPPALGIDTSDGGGTEGNPSDGGGVETEDPTAAAPDVPAPDPADYPGMDEETPEGAEQSLRYYIAVVYWGYQTGDREILETLHQDTCGTCMGFSEDIQDLREAGAYWSETSIDDFGIKHYDSETFDIEIGYIFTLGEHTEPATDQVEESLVPKDTFTVTTGLLWKDAGWLVGGLNMRETQIDVE